MKKEKETEESLKHQAEETVVLWSARYAKARGNQEQMFAAFERYYDSFYAVFRGTYAPWRSKVVDPKIASKAQAVIAKVSLADPEPIVDPTDEHDIVRARTHEELLKFQLRNPNFTEPMFLKKVSVLTDAVVTGSGFALAPWEFREKTFYTRRMDDNTVSKTSEKKKTMKVGYNEFLPQSVFRVFIDPAAQTLQGSTWVIVKDYKTTAKLKSLAKIQGWNLPPEDEIGTGDNDTEGHERSRNRLLSFMTGSQDKTGGSDHELMYCWDTDTQKRFVILNRTHLIFEDDIIDWHAKIPIVDFHVQPRAYSPWGIGLFERVERLGAANDSLINHFFDQLDLSMNGVMLREEATTISTYDLSPGGEIVYSTATQAPTFVDIPQPDIGGFQVARTMLSEAIEENTISAYEQGIPRSATDNTQGTKGGIQSIQEAAGDMVRFFETSIAQGYKTLYTIWSSNNMQYLDRDIALRVLGPDGYFPKFIKPEDIMTIGSIDISVDIDSMRPKNREEKALATLAYVDKQMAIAQTSLNMQEPMKLNYYELSRVAADALGVTGFDRVVEQNAVKMKSALEENQMILMGKDPEVNPMDDHQTHIMLHNRLIDDANVDEDLKKIALAHIEMHRHVQEMLDQQKAQQDLANLKATEAQTARDAGIPYPGMAMEQQAQAQMQGGQGNVQTQTAPAQPAQATSQFPGMA